MRRWGAGALAALACALVLAAPAPAGTARSPFAWRGIVEGPYGPPWDHGQRERMVRWMAVHGLNAYVHAPKDDLYQRTNWRDPYPVAAQREFDAEIRLARGLGVEWIPNLSPALPLIPTPAAPSQAPSRDLCFSCPADLDALVAKLEPFRRAGARTFMVSFDDVTKTLTHPEDAAAYGAGDEGFGRANGDFLTRLIRALKAREPRARLLTVGADYSGTTETPYLRGLRATLAPEVEIMWTGTDVPSRDFRAADARGYGAAIGRRPLVWDNWVNNDTAGNALPAGTSRIYLRALQAPRRARRRRGRVLLQPDERGRPQPAPAGHGGRLPAGPRSLPTPRLVAAGDRRPGPLPALARGPAGVGGDQLLDAAGPPGGAQLRSPRQHLPEHLPGGSALAGGRGERALGAALRRARARAPRRASRPSLRRAGGALPGVRARERRGRPHRR